MFVDMDAIIHDLAIPKIEYSSQDFPLKYIKQKLEEHFLTHHTAKAVGFLGR